MNLPKKNSLPLLFIIFKDSVGIYLKRLKKKNAYHRVYFNKLINLLGH
jgi:hypothetical protein